MNSNLGIVSKGGESFYTKKKIWIYDSNGKQFELKKAKLNGKANWKSSLRFFQQMYEMNLQFEEKSKIELTELKEIVIEHIKKHKRHWSSIGTLDGISEMINTQRSYSDLITKLK